VARNLGGSIGVSVANTLLAQRQQFHQVRLVEHVESASLNYQEALRRASDYFAQQGASMLDAQHQALGWVGGVVQAQASIMSYIDLFWLWALFAVAMIPLALLLRPVMPHEGGGPSVAH
jgi:DHA2 family multidrug resistance protein